MTSIWIPPQQKSLTNYMRWSTIITFILLMIAGIGYFYDEYQEAEYKKKEAKGVINEIEQHNAKVDEKKSQVITKQIKTKHRTVTMPDGSKLCTDHEEAASTGCKIVSNKEIDSILNRTEIIRYKEKTEEPTGGSPPPPMAVPIPIKPNVTTKEVTKTITVQPEVKETKIEIDAGLVKVAMSNEASWNAIFKMVFTLLFSFFGIKLINFGFRKLEGEYKPA